MVIKEPGDARAVNNILCKSQLLMKIMTTDLSDDTEFSGSWVDWFTKENFKIVSLIISIDLNSYAFRFFHIYQDDTIGKTAHISINQFHFVVVDHVTQSTPKKILTMSTGINLKTRFEFFE